jgi:hypothetical protein
MLKYLCLYIFKDNLFLSLYIKMNIDINTSPYLIRTLTNKINL